MQILIAVLFILNTVNSGVFFAFYMKIYNEMGGDQTESFRVLNNEKIFDLVL